MTTRYPFALIKEKLAERGGKALDFAIGRRRVPLPQPIDEWIRAHVDLAMRAASGAETREFVEAAADLLRREYGAEVDTRCILPAPGGRAAMSAFLACAVEPGQRVFVTEPGYPAFARLAAHRHASILELELDPQQDFAPDLGPLAGSSAAAPRVIALNYPNNPTGALLSPQIVSSLRDVSDSGTILFNDATYGPLVYGQQRHSLLNARMMGDHGSQVVELHSFAKLFPIGPIAVSFLAGSETTMHAIATYSEFAWSPLSALQLKATTLCLRDAARLEALREFFPAQLQKLRQTLTGLGFEPYPSPSGVYTICHTPAQIGGRPVASAAEAAARLMDEFDLAVVPLDTPHHSYLRFTSLYQLDELERLEGLRNRLQLR
jgi:aspartate/methionine/tyrosine aminotransferase